MTLILTPINTFPIRNTEIFQCQTKKQQSTKNISEYQSMTPKNVSKSQGYKTTSDTAFSIKGLPWGAAVSRRLKPKAESRKPATIWCIHPPEAAKWDKSTGLIHPRDRRVSDSAFDFKIYSRKCFNFVSVVLLRLVPVFRGVWRVFTNFCEVSFYDV